MTNVVCYKRNLVIKYRMKMQTLLAWIQILKFIFMKFFMTLIREWFLGFDTFVFHFL